MAHEYHLHLRDHIADSSFAELMGEDALDYAAIGKALHEVGFTGYPVIELSTPRNKQTRPSHLFLTPTSSTRAVHQMVSYRRCTLSLS